MSFSGTVPVDDQNQNVARPFPPHARQPRSLGPVGQSHQCDTARSQVRRKPAHPLPQRHPTDHFGQQNWLPQGAQLEGPVHVPHHPLSEHFRWRLQRFGKFGGAVPERQRESATNR